MKVINLYGGPGTGKTTTRANLFGLMKAYNLRVEEAPEFAKDLTYSENWTALRDQFYVTAGQEVRLSRLDGKVDWCISDSPLPLGLIYAVPGTRYDADWYRQAIWGLFDTYDNVNVMLKRVKPYQTYGRTQNEDEARVIDAQLRGLMAGRIDFEVEADAHAHLKIYERLTA